MANAFEYGDALLPQPPPDSPENNTNNVDEPTSPQLGCNQPYLNLATFVFLITPFTISPLTPSFIIFTGSAWSFLLKKFLSLSLRLTFQNLSNCILYLTPRFLLQILVYLVTSGHRSPRTTIRRCSTCLQMKLERP